MANNDLNFKLVLNADVKNFVANTKQSQETAQNLFNSIRNASQKMSAETQKTSGSVDKLISETAIQKAEKLSTEFLEAANVIRSLGDKSVISAGELLSMSSKGEQGIQQLKNALQLAEAELIRLQSTDGTLKDIETAKSRVIGLDDAIKQASSAFNLYQSTAVNAMKGVDESTQKTLNEIQKFSSVNLTGVIGEAQTVKRTIDSLGSSASISEKELERLGNLGAKSLDTLEKELTQARIALVQLNQSGNGVPLSQYNQAAERVHGLEMAIVLTKKAFDSLGASSGNGVEKIASDAKKASQALQETAQKAQRSSSDFSAFSGVLTPTRFAVSALTSALIGLGTVLSIKNLAETADSYTNLSTRIKIAVGDTGNFTQAMAGVQQIAVMTNSGLDGTARLFSKVNAVGKEMGLTQKQSLDLTKTINMAMQIGGESAQATEGAIIQLTQSLQSGVLRGDEFNSIMEQAPAISDALKRSLGVTTAQLRQMASEGQISSTTLMKALQGQSSFIQGEFNKFPVTIGTAINRLKTEWDIFIGSLDQSEGASKTVAEWIVLLADNMKSLSVISKDVGQGFVWVGDQLKKIDTATITAFKGALASTYDVLKQLLATTNQLSIDVLDVLGTSLTNALSIFSSFTGEVAKGGEQVSFLTRIFQGVNIALGALSDGISAIKIGFELLTGALFSVASASNRALAAMTWGDVSKQFSANADAMQQKAKEYYAQADSDAMAFQSKTLQNLDNAAKTQQEKDADSVVSAKSAMDQILSAKQSEGARSNQVDADKTAAVQAYAEAAIKANHGAMDGMMQADLIAKGYIVTLDQAGKVSVEAWAKDEQGAKNAVIANENLKQAKLELETFEKSSASRREALNQQIIDGRTSGDLTAVVSAQNSLSQIDAEHQKLTDRVKKRQIEVAQGSKASSDAAVNNAKTAATALGLDLDVAINKVSTGFKITENSVVDLARNLQSMGLTGEQAANITYQGWQKWLEKAKSKAEIDTAKAKLVEFKDTGVLSTKQVEAGMDAIRVATQKLPPALTPVEQAFERLGIKTKEQLRLAAEIAIADFKTISASGQATQDQLREAAERTMQAAQASGNQIAISAARSQASVAGLVTETDKAGKVVVQTTQQYVDSMEQVADAGNQAKGVFSSIGDESEDAAGRASNAWDKTTKSIKGASDALNNYTENSEAKKSGGSINAWYSKDNILQKLKEMGYSDDDSSKMADKLYKQSAGSSYMGATNASADYLKQHGIDPANASVMPNISNQMYVNEQLDKYKMQLSNQKTLQGYQQSADNASSNTSIGSTRTIKLESNGQTAMVQASQSQAETLESILEQLGQHKKSS